MTTQFPILIHGKTFSIPEQSNENASWVDALVAAHGRDSTYCTCTSSRPPKLVVKRYGAGTETVRYGLARWPGTGLDHVLTCRFFTEDDDDGAEAQPALEDLGDGRVRIHLAESLRRTAQKGKAAEFARSLAPTDKESTGTVRRQDLASQDMLLRKLWRHAGLNVCRGSARAWYQIAFTVLQASQRIIVNRKGETLADYLYVVAAQSDKAISVHNQAVIAHVEATGSRMYVLGRLRDYHREKERVLLPVIERRGLPKTLITTEMLCHSLGEGNFVRNVLDGENGMVIGLATIEPDGGEWWKTLSLAAMTTSASGLPADSSAELDFEVFLREQGRTFLKPLQLRAVQSEAVRPAYILLDTADRQRWEVWGATEECQLSVMRARMKEAEAAGRPVAAWSANPRQAYPSLDPKNDLLPSRSSLP